MPELSRPHYGKLIACLENPRFPDADKELLEEAVRKYHEWIDELESVERGKVDTVEKLVEITNKYKRFIELDLIFDSTDNFLYRQKGQLKLDNTILEEFLPQLVFRSLRGIDESFELGPRNTFAGLSFLSSVDIFRNIFTFSKSIPQPLPAAPIAEYARISTKLIHFARSHF